MEILLDHIEPELTLKIEGDSKESAFIVSEEQALQFAESQYQIKEGCSYEYKFSKSDYELVHKPPIVSVSKFDRFKGRITPNIYVGQLALEMRNISEPGKVLQAINIEVIATKLGDSTEPELDTDYRKNYRSMLEDIAVKCSDLLMQINSPVSQNFEPDFSHENETVYQRFAFIKYLILSDEFNEAVNRILYSPATIWKETEEPVDIRKIKRFSNSSMRKILSATDRIPYELNQSIHSVPSKIFYAKKTETYDTPENRFIRFALEMFTKFCEDCLKRFQELKNYSKAENEATALVSMLQNYLNNPFFREISRPVTLQLNSPLLQRKGGYREILNAWILFDLAAKLVWKGGDKVYRTGKRDIAVLYEYWLFFELYDLLINKFEFDQIKHGKEIVSNLIDKEDISHLTEKTKDGLGLKLKSGVETSLTGRTRKESRELCIRFSYNRTFSGNTRYKKVNDDWIAEPGSWTKPLRPDYSLSIWPSSIEEEAAEKEDLIVHIHFDAKYKVKHFQIDDKVKDELDEDGDEIDSLEKEKKEERKGIYKNADLMKMHAYKDAIRRTGGAYILYPGTETPENQSRGFHEIIPGLGAFAIRPSSENTGISELSSFIDDVISHFQDRANQRERYSIKGNEIHRVKKADYKTDGETLNILNEPIPEYLDFSRKIKLIPDETFVLIAYCKSESHLKWVRETKLYNSRIGKTRDDITLRQKELGAKLILLHLEGNPVSSEIFIMKPDGTLTLTREDLIRKKYPSEPTVEYYLGFTFEEDISEGFATQTWNVKSLVANSASRNIKRPFAVSLSELLEAKVE